MITDSIVALALGLEEAEDSVMKEAPADPKEPLIGGAMWVRILLHSLWSTALFICYYVWMLERYTDNWLGKFTEALPSSQTEKTIFDFCETNSEVDYCKRRKDHQDGVTAARTALVILLVSSEMFRGYCSKNFDTNDWRFNNCLLNFSVFSGIGLTIAIALIPEVDEFFSLGGKILDDWVGLGSALLLALTVFPIDVLLKYFIPRKKSFHTHKVVEAKEVPNPSRYGLAATEPDHVEIEVDDAKE